MSNPARKTYYAEARRLTPAVRCTLTLPDGQKAFGRMLGRGLNRRRVRLLGSFRLVGPVTETWDVNTPKADFASFQIPPSPPPDDQFCEPDPHPDAGEASVSQEFVLENPTSPPPGECPCCCSGEPTGFTLTVAPLEIPGPGGRCIVTVSDDE